MDRIKQRKRQREKDLEQNHTKIQLKDEVKKVYEIQKSSIIFPSNSQKKKYPMSKRLLVIEKKPKSKG